MFLDRLLLLLHSSQSYHVGWYFRILWLRKFLFHGALSSFWRLDWSWRSLLKIDGFVVVAIQRQWSNIALISYLQWQWDIWDFFLFWLKNSLRSPTLELVGLLIEATSPPINIFEIEESIPLKILVTNLTSSLFSWRLSFCWNWYNWDQQTISLRS